MNFQNPSFVRKIAYLAAIVLLLPPIAYLSQPATVGRGGGGNVSAGGKLSKLRVQYNLSQAELGEIDPASETMKLATLGLRGIAVNALWSSALHYQKVKDFNALELTVKQIIRLQPNFLKVWDFQAHNLSYNTSVEFDNFRDRYEWVKKGIAFLILGTQYNRDEPGLLNTVGWFVGQKLGRSDENRQFRRLFKDDKDFHAEFRKHGVDVDMATVLGKPDSWLVSKLWYDKAEESVARGRPLRLKSPLLFYNSAPMALINHASALEKEDGIFGDTAQFAWMRADGAWSRYGSREILSSSGYMIRLNSTEELDQRHNGLEDELTKLVPGVREKLHAEKLAALKPEERAIVDKPANQRSYEESMRMIYELGPKINVSADEVVTHAPGDKRTAARELADRIAANNEVRSTTASYRNIVNYEYWESRCRAEQLPIALNARELVQKADRIRKRAGELSQARRMYEEAWENWAELFEKFPVLLDSVEGGELVESVAHYRELLSSLDEDFPANFRLSELLKRVQQGRALLEEIQVVQGPPTGQKKSEPPSLKVEPANDAKTPSPSTPAKDKQPDKGPAKGDAPNPDKGEDKPAKSSDAAATKGNAVPRADASQDK